MAFYLKDNLFLLAEIERWFKFKGKAYWKNIGIKK